MHGAWLVFVQEPPAHSFTHLLGVLIALIIATKLLGGIAQRFGQPSVLGELVAGVILGGSLLGIVDPGDPVIAAFAEIGVLVLLFQIGLHTDLSGLIKVGASATMVALVGVAVPFALGFAVARGFGIDTVPALVVGAALTATSVGISARVLSDLGKLDSPEGQIVLGAAVLDDIVGLVILSVVAGIVGGGDVTVGSVAWITTVALGFVIVALIAGSIAIPPIFRVLGRSRVEGTLGLFALAFAFTLAWLADAAGSALIIGAFAAGLILHPTPQVKEVERAVTTLGHLFVPIFFASVGAAVDLRALGDPRALMIGGALIVVGVLGKVAAGWAPWWFRGRNLLIGVAMVPRGEVGLIFAQMGLTTGAIGADLFGAIMLMVLVTTLVTPPVLGRVAGAASLARGADQPGAGGIDDLVSGTMPTRRDRAVSTRIETLNEDDSPDLEDEPADGLTPSERAAIRAQQRIEARLAKLAAERAKSVTASDAVDAPDRHAAPRTVADRDALSPDAEAGSTRPPPAKTGNDPGQ
jgi:Kef-type K+ transport system membrane component KefB